MTPFAPSPEQVSAFRREGWTKLPRLLDDAELARVQEIYEIEERTGASTLMGQVTDDGDDALDVLTDAQITARSKRLFEEETKNQKGEEKEDDKPAPKRDPGDKQRRLEEYKKSREERRKQYEEDSKLLVLVLLNLSIELANQRYDLLSQLTSKDVDDGAMTVPTCVANRFAFLGPCDVFDMEGGNCVSRLEPRLE